VSLPRVPVVLALLAVLYLPLFAELSQANYNPLVNGYRAYGRTSMGTWPTVLASQLNPLHPTEWLYRPLPESMEWAFSEVFRRWPGGWYVAVLGVRVLMVALVWMLSGWLSTSMATRAAVTSYAALFPSFPEPQLIYAETPLLALLAAVLFGLARLCAEEDPPPGLVAATAVAFVLLTLCKEILAPMSAVLFAALLLPLRPWRSRAGRVAGLVMGMALLLQALHCARAVAAPYANPAAALDRSAQVLGNLKWFVGHTLLWTTNLKLTSLLLAGLLAAGTVAAGRRVLSGRWREALPALAGSAALLGVLAVHLGTPYQAVRYIYPAAVLLVPTLALGLAALGARWATARTGVALVLVLTLAMLNAPALWAQAVSMRRSTEADWALLELLALRRADGEGVDVALSATMGKERIQAILFEQAGVWRIPGFSPPRGRGHVVEFAYELPQPTPPRDLVLVAPPDAVGVPDLGPGVELRVPPSAALPLFGRFLTGFERVARRLNPAYAYPCDAGSSPFPGHHWRVLVKSAS
jgi:hypothetical protein